MKIYYEDILVTDFSSNKSMTIEEILEQIEFNEQEFCEMHSLDGLDYGLFRMEV